LAATTDIESDPESRLPAMAAKPKQKRYRPIATAAQSERSIAKTAQFQ